MNLLTIDAGNSRCKFCFASADGDFPAKTTESIEIDAIESRFQDFAEFDSCVVSSVNDQASQGLKKVLSGKVASGQLLFLDFQSAPMALEVQTPATLGADRIAAAHGAYLRTQAATIVADFGTAVTVDLVDSKGRFCGGTIFPGSGLSTKVLAQQSDKLPPVEQVFDPPPPLPGKNTSSAIQAGLFWSQVGAIERIACDYAEKFGELQLVVTGGAGDQILASSSLLGDYVPHLVLEGLWQIGIDQLANRNG